jgi:hypothetical protein
MHSLLIQVGKCNNAIVAGGRDFCHTTYFILSIVKGKFPINIVAPGGASFQPLCRQHLQEERERIHISKIRKLTEVAIWNEYTCGSSILSSYRHYSSIYNISI